MSPESPPARRRRIALIGLALTAVLVAIACTTLLRARGPGYDDDRLAEPSGLTAGRQPGVYWTHNDSGDGPVLYAVTIDGRVLGRFVVEGAGAEDWESVTSDGRGMLYVGDIGNNANDRRDLVVYRVPEPDVVPGGPDGAVTAARAIRFHYPDQTEFPAKVRNFDAEALFWDPQAGGGTLYLLSKHRGDMRTVLYRFDDLEAAESIALNPRGSFEVGGDPDRYGGMVTGADLSPDGRHLAVLTYHALFVFERPASGDDWLGELRNRIDFDQDVTVQAEAVAWDGDTIVFTNEQGAIFRVEAPLKPREGRFP